MMRRSIALLTAAALLATACDNAGEDLGLPDLPRGAIGIGVVLDRDGSGTVTPFDTSLADVRVALFAAGGHDTVVAAVTDADGFAIFDSVPIGRYSFALVPASLGDTLPVIIMPDDGDFEIIAQRDGATGTATALVSYATLDLAAARQAPAGRPIFVRGIVASALQYHPDSASYLTDGEAYLRVIPSQHRPGRTGNNVGDSVIVFGTTGVEAGQPVLLNGLIATLAERQAPIPVAIGVADIVTARGGSLDAALVSVDSAVIVDTTTSGAQFVVRVAVAPDTATIRVDSTLHVPNSVFELGRSLRFRGVLVPLGDGTWYLRPRPLNNELTVLP